MRNTMSIGGSEATALATAKDTRVELRTSFITKEKIRSASALAGVDMSSFILMAAVEKAQMLIDKQMIRTLSTDAWETLNELINAPAEDKDDDLKRLVLGERRYVRR